MYTHPGYDAPLQGRVLTFGEAVAEIAKATGRELTYRAVSAREYGERLAGREPRDFTEFAREAAAAGTWKA